MIDAERCISCGDIIPEGRQVCLKCEASQTLQEAHQFQSKSTKIERKKKLRLKTKGGNRYENIY